MNKNKYNIDAKLVIDYQSGDNLALAQLVKRWHKTFCNKAHWIVRDKHVAKDIAQDTWKVIIEKIAGLKDPNTFPSWSLRIVCNKSFDWIKKNNKARDNLETYKYAEETTEISEDDNREQLRYVLLKGIKELPAHQQMVVKLFYTEEYSLKEIGKILNISVGTAKSRLYHAREALKLILKNH